VKFQIVFALVMTSTLFVAGCAEPLTYSQDFKREGTRQFNRGEFVDASGSFKAAAKQDPTDYQTQYLLGLSYEKSGNEQLAAEAYRLCLKLRPQMPAGRADIAMREKVIGRLAGLVAHGTFTEAQIDSIQTEAQETKSADDYRLLARILALRGDGDSAVANYRRAINTAPDDFLLTKEFAFYMLKINQTAEGTRLLKTAWQLDPSDRQVAIKLRELGVNDSQLAVSPTRIEEQAADTSAPASNWDAMTVPRD